MKIFNKKSSECALKGIDPTNMRLDRDSEGQISSGNISDVDLDEKLRCVSPKADICMVP